MMKCPHCKKEIGEIEEGHFAEDKMLFIKNFIFVGVPFAMVFSLLNKYTSIPLSIEDGLKWNLYLLPIIVVAVFYFIYGMLYNSKKVKGRFLIFKENEKQK